MTACKQPLAAASSELLATEYVLRLLRDIWGSCFHISWILQQGEWIFQPILGLGRRRRRLLQEDRQQ